MILEASKKYLFGRFGYRRIGRILLPGFLVVQLLLGYVGQMGLAPAGGILPGSVVKEAQAQGLVNPLNPDVHTTNVNVPTYTGRGVEESIRTYLCAPGDSTDSETLGTELFTCISKMYRFGIAFGAIALVFFVVYAGYIYMTGGESAKTKAKSTLFSALIGMGIILSSFVLLSFISPDLVKIRPIQPPIFTASNLPSCDSVGFGRNCVLPSGQVFTGGSGTASANLKQYEPLIKRYAQQYQIDFCALNALLDLESSGIYNNVSNGPPNRVDPNHPDKKFYGLPFTRTAKGSSLRGHGIGLGQIFIYGPPPTGSDGDRWSPQGTPSRPGGQFGFDRPLTITDLINPETNISAAAYHFARVKLPHHTVGSEIDRYANAYASRSNSYHGAGSINGVDVNRVYRTKFNQCKGLNL